MQGDSPNVTYGGWQQDYRRLFYSEEEDVLKVPIQLAPGFGVIKAGQALSLNGSASGESGLYFPYCPTSITGLEQNTGRSYLVAPTVAGSNLIYVSLSDSWRYRVGDELYVQDNTTAAQNLGPITAIDRTSYTNMAKITVTNNAGVTVFAVTNFAFVAHKGYGVCATFSGKSVDTGVGEKAVGAGGIAILGNFVVYKNCLINVDDDAMTDLGLKTIGIYAYIG